MKASFRPLGVLLLGVAWCGLVVAQDVAQHEESVAQPHEFRLDLFEAERTGEGHMRKLDEIQLDEIRGRYVPAAELELDRPWGVILWDEGKGSRSGSGPGTSQSQTGSNQQRQSMSTTTIR